MSDRIIAFIEKTFKAHIYEKLRKCDPENGFESYEHFINHNKQMVENLNYRDLEFLLKLIEEIENGTIFHADTEHFASMKTSFIYFDKNQKLILVNK